MTKLFFAAVAPLVLAACATVPVEPVTAPGPDFLARNGAVKGVVTTPSGLEYLVLKSGPRNGPQPRDGDKVTFHYEGKLTDGTVFDSSIARGEPLSGGVGDFVPGFTEALKLMHPGDEWIVWIPPALGYGAKQVDVIPPNSVLRFKLILISVERGAAPTK
jgi:FKBP-type peptidyl-prolyl cis-trans isomerase